MTHDLTFVAPERRDEVRRRIDVVEEFIAAPGRAAAEVAAGKLGLHTAQFYNLVRAWRGAQKPETMMGRNAPRIMTPRIDGRVLNVIDRIIAENGRAPANEVVERVNAELSAGGIPMPDPGTVARHVRRKRPSLLTGDIRGRYDLIIDHTVIDLPVDFGGAVRRPLITFAIDVAVDAIVGMALSATTPRPTATAAALLDAMRHGTRNAVSRSKPKIAIVANSDAESSAVIDALAEHGMEALRHETHSHGGGIVIDALLGREHAGLHFRQRLVWNEGRRPCGIAPGKTALTAQDAETMVRDRLLDDRATSAFAGLDDAGRRRLANDLSALAQAG